MVSTWVCTSDSKMSLKIRRRNGWCLSRFRRLLLVAFVRDQQGHRFKGMSQGYTSGTISCFWYSERFSRGSAFPKLERCQLLEVPATRGTQSPPFTLFNFQDLKSATLESLYHNRIVFSALHLWLRFPQDPPPNLSPHRNNNNNQCWLHLLQS